MSSNSGDVPISATTQISEQEQNARRLAMAAHLLPLTGILIPFSNSFGPFAVWYSQRHKNEFAAAHARTAFNFHANVTIATLLFTLLSISLATLSSFAIIAGTFITSVVSGFIIFPLIGIACFVLMIMATISANDGKKFRYPALIDIATMVEGFLPKSQ